MSKTNLTEVSSCSRKQMRRPQASTPLLPCRQPHERVPRVNSRKWIHASIYTSRCSCKNPPKIHPLSRMDLNHASTYAARRAPKTDRGCSPPLHKPRGRPIPLAFFEAIFFSLVEQVGFRTAEVDNLWASASRQAGRQGGERQRRCSKTSP